MNRFAALIVPLLVPLAVAGCPTLPEQCTYPAGEAVDVSLGGHVDEESESSSEHNPPAGGDHARRWAEYREHDEVVPRAVWLHNIEHGAMVLLHRPDAPAEAIAALQEAYAALPEDEACGHSRALLTPDPDLDSAVAAVVWGFVLQGDILAVDDVVGLAEACRGNAPEDVCASGGEVPFPF